MKNPKVDEYINKSQPFAQPILKHLREIIHKVIPDVEETTKWGMPHFEKQGVICSFASFKEHCAFGFRKESLMPDLQKYLKDHVVGKSTAMGTWGRITSLENLPPDAKIIQWLKEAEVLNKKGVKVKRVAKPKQKHQMPNYLRDELEANDVLEAYSLRPPYQQNDYIGWVGEAKQDETRQKRIEQMIDELKKGNVYMKMKWGK